MKPNFDTSISEPKMKFEPAATKLRIFTNAPPSQSKDVLAARHQQHQRGEGDLQRHAGDHQLPVHVAAVEGEQPGDAEQHAQAEEAEQDVEHGRG
jgi:hypothetical protein